MKVFPFISLSLHPIIVFQRGTAMDEQSILIPGGVELHSVYQAPDAANDRHAGIVFIHGWSGYGIGPHRMFINAARRLTADGFHCVRLDLRGRGDSLGDERTADLDGMIDDTLSAVHLLRERGVQDVYVLGICSGGNVSLGAASLDKSLAGLVLWSTPLFAPYKARTEELRRTGFFLAEYVRKAFRRETWAKLAAGAINFRIIIRILLGKGRGSPAPKSQRNPKDSLRDIMTELKGFPGRMIFIYGSADDEAAGAPEFYRQYCQQNAIPAVFHTVQGANHSYYSIDWEREVIDKTVNWLKANGER